MATFEDVAALADSVDGWLSRREGEVLYRLAQSCRRGHGVIVEIGSWKGKSTTWLAGGSISGQSVLVYAVDPHIGFPDVPETYGRMWTFDEFMDNIRAAGVEDVVVPIVKTSVEAAAEFNESISLLFIDGVHEFDYVKADFESWFPLVAVGGTIAFHDTAGHAHTGAKRFVEQRVYRSRDFRAIRFIDSMTIVEKVAHNQPLDVARAYWCLYLKRLVDLVPMDRVPRPVRMAGRWALHRLQGLRS